MWIPTRLGFDDNSTRLPALADVADSLSRAKLPVAAAGVVLLALVLLLCRCRGGGRYPVDEKPAWPPSRSKLMTPKREARRAKKSGQLLHDADVLVD